MHFQPSHLTSGARHNPEKKAGAKGTRTTAKLPKGQRQRDASALKLALKERAKARLKQQRAARAQQLGVPPEHPAAEVPVSPTTTTLLTAEEQAAWSQTGLPLPTDAELLSASEEGEFLLDESVVELPAPAGEEEEEEGGKGKYVLAAAAAAVAAFFALR
jgi:hypothetical protein